jgi:hypothetical protein
VAFLNSFVFWVITQTLADGIDRLFETLMRNQPTLRNNPGDGTIRIFNIFNAMVWPGLAPCWRRFSQIYSLLKILKNVG